MSSQSLLQLNKHRSVSAAHRAAAELRAAGRAAHDQKLVNMASFVSGLQGHFDDVISAIDEMITLLKQQNEEDLTNKEACEQSRMADSRDSIVAARSIDDMSDRISKLEADIVEISAEIKSKDEEIAHITEEMSEAKQQRERENEDWVRSNADDEQAIQVVNSAKDVLENFYKENNLVFSQTAKAPTVAAGEAPPPPPKTWDEPYGGKKQESGSIVTILTLIAEDMAKDKQKAKAEEDSAQAAYDEDKQESESQIQSLRADVSDLETTKGEKEEDIESTKGSRKTKKQELDNFMQKMADAEVGCDYIALNFEVRKKNRDTELDGLQKAKAILEGGDFS
jgi:chromosome segregation ATPase